ncbi:hypothetical protein K2P56_00235 [Patescibacteria group bacterium]|nr:hypothetical protein [Patescibacteria group bacterium]
MPQKERKTNGHDSLGAFAELFTHLTTHTGNDSMDACPKRAFQIRKKWQKCSGLEREAYFVQLIAEMEGLRRNRRFDEFMKLVDTANKKAGIITTENPRDEAD